MGGFRWPEGLSWPQVKTPLKVAGIVCLGLASVLGLADLLGYFEYGDRNVVLDWVLTSGSGLPIDESAARAFMARFPPPSGARPLEITHLVKQVIRTQGGPVMNASINYMHADESRTTAVATLAEVRKWAGEDRWWLRFAWWILGFLGFVEVLARTLFKRHEAQAEA